jgi:ubiquinone/menaquinone biosynthesis C-methylase UbiE
MQSIHTQKVSHLFDQWAQSDRLERMAKGHSPLLQPLIELWDFSKAEKVLDLGCGNGYALKFCLEQGAKQVAGVDIAPEMIKAAKANLPEGDFQLAEIDQLPWKDNSFTHILSVEAFYYLKDPMTGLKEARRVLKEDGRIAIIIEFFHENKGSHVWPESLGLEMALWSEKEWQEAALKAGFKNAKTQRIYREKLKTKAEFVPSSSFPSYEQYLDYAGAGALMIYN